MRIGIIGIRGRVSRLLINEVRAAGAELVGGTTRSGQQGDPGCRMFADLRMLAEASQAVIDFTHPDTTAAHSAILAETDTAWVLGTTGLTAQAQDAVSFAAHRIPVVQAANFSPGVTLVLELAQRLAAALPAAEYDAGVLEMHHRQKIDQPSGTALAIGAAIRAGSDPGEPRPVGYASLRGGQIVGEHTVLFTAAGEQISLGHRAFDRRTFAAGAVRAALWTAGRIPGLYGMRDVLHLP